MRPTRTSATICPPTGPMRGPRLEQVAAFDRSHDGPTRQALRHSGRNDTATDRPRWLTEHVRAFGDTLPLAGMRVRPVLVGRVDAKGNGGPSIRASVGPARGRFDRATDLCAQIGSRPDEVFAHLQAQSSCSPAAAPRAPRTCNARLPSTARLEPAPTSGGGGDTRRHCVAGAIAAVAFVQIDGLREPANTPDLHRRHKLDPRGAQ
jgi:hypothetical protein